MLLFMKLINNSAVLQMHQRSVTSENGREHPKPSKLPNYSHIIIAIL